MPITIDASVFVAAALIQDVNHVASDGFVTRIRANEERAVCPSILITECGCAIARRTGNPTFGMAAATSIAAIPSLILVDIDTVRAEAAARIGSGGGLRGADAIYVAVAQESLATLITWDNEMLTRAGVAVTTMTPSDWLAANPEESPST